MHYKNLFKKNSKQELKGVMVGGYPLDENMAKREIESATLGLSIGIAKRGNISIPKYI